MTGHWDKRLDFDVSVNEEKGLCNTQSCEDLSSREKSVSEGPEGPRDFSILVTRSGISNPPISGL